MENNGDSSVYNFLDILNSLEGENDAQLKNSEVRSDVVLDEHDKSNILDGEMALKSQELKSLFVESDNADLGSTGISDKSSFGSDTNDSNEMLQSSSETVLPQVNGFSADPLSRPFREASQSPAFFGFSSSNSSSPPLSQTSGPSSASSLAEAVTTKAAFKCGPTLSNVSPSGSNATFQAIVPTNSAFCSQPVKSPFATKSDNFCFTPTNPLDNVFDSLLASHNRNGMASDSIGDISSVLLENTSFGPSGEPFNFEPRRSSSQSQAGMMPVTQDALPHLFSNPLSAFTAESSGDHFAGQRKMPIFNNNVSNASTMVSSSSTLSSPIISNSLFTTNFLMNNDPLEQRNNFSSLTPFNSPVNYQPQTQARFEYQIRTITNEINSTVQLYLNSIQMRKEQLLKQLDHVKTSYSLLMSQHPNKTKMLSQIPKIAFNRPDPSLFKAITSFGYISTPAYAPYCGASGEGLSVAIEGEPTCFSISTRNCFNEEILSGGEGIDIDIQPLESNAPPNSFLASTLHIQKNVLDNNNGKYSVTYMIPRGSNFRTIKILIYINGLAISNSPFLATVRNERLRESWKLMAMFGEEGTDPGKFCRPWGVAIHRLPLQKDPHHKLIGDNGQPTTIPNGSKPFYAWNTIGGNPRKDYLITVADRSNNRIQIIKLSLIENSNSSVQGHADKVDISVMHIFGTGPGMRPGQFDRPAGVAINANLGHLLVADKDNHRIQVFDLAGNFMYKFGEKGSRPGQFCYPWDIAVCPQTSLILVSDTRNRRIQVFTHFGQYLWHCGQPLDSPRGVAFLTPDRYIVSDFNKHRLLILDKNDINTHGSQHMSHRDEMITSKYIGFGEGSAWGEFLRPQGLVASVNKNPNGAKFIQILCADSRNNRIAIYNSLNQHFEYIQEHGPKSKSSDGHKIGFDRPSGIAMADNILAVVDFGNNRLQFYQKIFC